MIVAGTNKDNYTDFFPYVDGWQDAYDQCFDLNLEATFNNTHYDFQGFKDLYTSIAASIWENMDVTFDHQFISVVAVPDPIDLGGFVTATGWEGGMMDGRSWFYNATDAVYAVIREQRGCELKITEFRESSNLGFGKTE